MTSRKRLEEILVEVRQDGFALNDQELEIGLRSIAVPVRNVVGTVVAAMNVSTQASRVSRRELIERCLPMLRTPRKSWAASFRRRVSAETRTEVYRSRADTVSAAPACT